MPIGPNARHRWYSKQGSEARSTQQLLSQNNKRQNAGSVDSLGQSILDYVPFLKSTREL
jgi:hypothetical protein